MDFLTNEKLIDDGILDSIDIIIHKDQPIKYMLPNQLVHFEQLPKNKNARINRVKLKEQFIDAADQ